METRTVKGRMGHIDDARSLVIYLVVMLHASVTYSGIGGWYLIENESGSIGTASFVLCGLFNSFNQAWFMGIMFFFAGYFAREALGRKGVGAFVRDRLARLGIPLLGFVLVINPLMMYYIAYPEEFGAMGSFPALYLAKWIGGGMFLGETGPLWFVQTLLAFSLVLALIVAVRDRLRGHSNGRPSMPDNRPDAVPSATSGAAVSSDTTAVSPSQHSSTRASRAPSTASLLAIILATAAFAFAVRVFLPIGTDWMNLQFCFFPSYIVLFALGSRGASGGWFADLTGGRNSRWLAVSLALGIPLWAAVMYLGGALDAGFDRFSGGFTAQSAAYCLWESLVAVGMSVGLTAFLANRRAAREAKGQEAGALSRFLARNSFSVFVFHPVFLIALTRLLSGWALMPALKALVVGSLAYALSLLFAELVVRRVPGVRRYF